MPGNATYQYSRRPGDSVFPIYPGAVLKLKKLKNKRNRFADGVHLDHDTYIWIHAVGPNPKYNQPKKRPVNMVTADVPVLENLKDRVLCRKSRVMFQSVALMLSYGYEELGDIEFNGTDHCWTVFYKKIGCWKKKNKQKIV